MAVELEKQHRLANIGKREFPEQRTEPSEGKKLPINNSGYFLGLKDISLLIKRDLNRNAAQHHKWKRCIPRHFDMEYRNIGDKQKIAQTGRETHTEY